VTHEELRAIMTDLGISQRSLARAAGVTHAAAGWWWHGPRPGRPAKIPAAAVKLLRQARRRGYWKPPPL